MQNTGYFFTFDVMKTKAVLDHHVDYERVDYHRYQDVKTGITYRIVDVSRRESVAGISRDALISPKFLSGRPVNIGSEVYREAIEFLRSRFTGIKL